MVIGKDQSDEREISCQGPGQLPEHLFLEIAKIEIQAINAIVILLAFARLQNLGNDFHALRRDAAVHGAQRTASPQKY